MTVGRRFPVAIGASLLVNGIVWAVVGSAFATHVVASPVPIEIQRIVLHPDGKKVVKVVKPEEVEKKVKRIVKENHLTPPPKPKEPKPAPPKRRVEAPRPSAPPSRPTAPPPPQGAHNKVVTAKATSAPKPQDFTALAGGNALTGKPTTAQAPGTAATSPANPLTVAPPSAVETKPDSKSTAPLTDPGPKADPKPAAPTPAAPPPQPPPAPPEKPKKKGPSRDAQYANAVNPTFPDELKSQEFKRFVRVKVDIAADGSFTATLRTSSGNDEVDKRVLDALKKWTWRPKLVDGEPVDSTQLFRFDFEIK